MNGVSASRSLYVGIYRAAGEVYVFLLRRSDSNLYLLMFVVHLRPRIQIYRITCHDEVLEDKDVFPAIPGGRDKRHPSNFPQYAYVS